MLTHVIVLPAAASAAEPAATAPATLAQRFSSPNYQVCNYTSSAAAWEIE